MNYLSTGTEEGLTEALNTNTYADVLQKWGTIDEYFSIYELEGALELRSIIRNEFKAGREDMLRRWERVQARNIEFEEQEEKQREKNQVHQCVS